jgi:ADP-ribose pyrophosphatase YjhB (NUDIX family)
LASALRVAAKIRPYFILALDGGPATAFGLGFVWPNFAGNATPEESDDRPWDEIDIWRKMQREFPSAPLLGVGAVIVEAGRVLLVKRGTEPLKGHWSMPGGLIELGEGLLNAVVREVSEETGLVVEPVELIELLDRIHRDGDRVRYHYVIADYLCRVKGGKLLAASDADAVRWVERAEWNSHSALQLDPITVRVIELGWQRAQNLRKEIREGR